jgi:hypothetical protein
MQQVPAEVEQLLVGKATEYDGSAQIAAPAAKAPGLPGLVALGATRLRAAALSKEAFAALGADAAAGNTVALNRLIQLAKQKDGGQAAIAELFNAGEVAIPALKDLLKGNVVAVALDSQKFIVQVARTYADPNVSVRLLEAALESPGKGIAEAARKAILEAGDAGKLEFRELAFRMKASLASDGEVLTMQEYKNMKALMD